MHPALNIMIKAARRASQIINRASQDLEHVKVAAKQQSDFVTEVDKAAEAAIITVLREAYPDYGILAEESGLTAGSGAGNDYQWIIDPLDGTTNFIHGFPQYSVSIALAYKGQPNQAIVYDTVRNEMFTASKGGGAFLNERRIRVADKRTKIDTALLGTGFPYRMFPHIDAYLAMYKDFTQRSAGIRRAGSAALDLAYVACGRLDGFWEIGLKPWDSAAGSLLVTEAGGLVGDLSGADNYLATGNIVAASPKVFAQMLQTIEPHRTPALQA